MSKASLREGFLKQNWSPYPAMPLGASLCGRIVSISPSAIQLQDGLEYKIDSMTKLVGLVLAGVGIETILCPGDLIAVEGETIYLLAPRLAKMELELPPLVVRQNWIRFLDAIRSFLSSLGLQQVQTPSLVVCPGTEPYLAPMQTQISQGKNRRKLFLPTSPELHLKKLLALDSGPIFEMKSCFRDNEVGTNHAPEFTMLEWYRPFASLTQIEEDLQGLVSSLWGRKVELKRRSMQETFKLAMGFDLSPDMGLEDYRKLCKQQEVLFVESDSIGELFHRVFIEKIEPFIKADEFLILHSFPPFLAAYARLDDHKWADRFELYCHGLEIANAFHEVNDPQLQRRRMIEDQNLRKKLGKTEVPLDEEFLLALESGMPPSGGIALGVERLFMVRYGLQAIQELQSFPWERLFHNNSE